MDCEKVESLLMDELYGELDEITSAAVKRHVAGCARCAALLNGMRATRRVVAVPMVNAPAGLEERILAAATAYGAPGATLQWRFARAISLAGNWAMRPQTAMAAVFLVMIGTSVLLLRGRSSRAPASAEMIVTEEGTPVPAASTAPTHDSRDAPTSAVAAATSAATRDPGTDKGGLFAAPPQPVQAQAPVMAAAPLVASPAAAPQAPAEVAEVARKTAKRAFKADEEPASDQPLVVPAHSVASGTGGAGAVSAGAPAQLGGPFAQAPPPAATSFDSDGELARARAERDDAARRGLPCPSVAKFNEVVARAGGTAAGWDAVYEGALCYASMGDYANARNRLNVLLRVDTYKDRAREQLDELSRRQRPTSAPAGETTARPPAAEAPTKAGAPTP